MPDDPLMLSVSGMRGLVGRSLTPPVAARYGAAFGQHLKQTVASGRAPFVVLARDSRPSGPMIELSVAAGLIGVGCRVVRLGIVTTPGAAIMIPHLGADGGMVITASHNPIEWNGIKALRHDGVAPPSDEAAQLIDRFHAESACYVPVEQLQPATDDDTTGDVHIERVLAQVDAGMIRQRGLTVALDSVHGAGGPVTARLLDALGVRLVHLWAEPTGLFPHEPEPLRENITGLCDAVREHRADIGFVQDPDADRLAIVDELGTYIGEEYTLALVTRHMMARDAAADRTAVTNLSTSRMVDDIAARHDGRVVRTPVGESNVAAAMRHEGAMIGGEGNGGVMYPGVGLVRDSLIGIALVLESLAQTDGALSAIVADIPRYHMLKSKRALPSGGFDATTMRDALARRFPGATFDEQDGVRIDWPDRWVHLRASNPEPVMRIIAEAATEADARDLIDQVTQVIEAG
ncbi:MAG: phosphoglucosamine mutase [Phycisphaeraceae bacterium]|nr:phosphoglucosamine mutase [Phycisphaeraceae bacterium]